MIELEKQEFEFKFQGEVYKISEPSVRDIEQMEVDKVKEDGKSAIEPMLDFLNGLGLPKEIGYKMTAGNIEKIVDSVVGEKKD